MTLDLSPDQPVETMPDPQPAATTIATVITVDTVPVRVSERPDGSLRVRVKPCVRVRVLPGDSLSRCTSPTRSGRQTIPGQSARQRRDQRRCTGGRALESPVTG